MPGGTDTFLYHLDLALNLGNVLVGSNGIGYDALGCQRMFHQNKFTIHKHGCDLKATGGIYGLDVGRCGYNLGDLSRAEMLGCCELDVVANGGKEENFIDKEDVTGERHMLVPREDFWGNRNIIRCHGMWGLTSSFPF